VYFKRNQQFVVETEFNRLDASLVVLELFLDFLLGQIDDVDDATTPLVQFTFRCCQKFSVAGLGKTRKAHVGHRKHRLLTSLRHLDDDFVVQGVDHCA
jgi:hypothetical protein